MVPREGLLLFGNDIHHKSILHGPENLMVNPPGFGGIANEELVIQTYHVPIKGSDENEFRTILSVIPAQLTSFKAFFTSYRAFRTSSLISSSTNVIDYSEGKVAQAFAAKLHGFTHLPIDDMSELCTEGGVLTPVLRQALQGAYNNILQVHTLPHYRQAPPI